MVEKVLLDDFVSAPLVWLPPAYLIKAIVFDYSFEEGMQKYWKDITTHGLLWRYWAVWVPAQTISFSVVPDHLQVAFMASVSFFWFILFSPVSSQEDHDNPAADDDPIMDHSLSTSHPDRHHNILLEAWKLKEKEKEDPRTNFVVGSRER